MSSMFETARQELGSEVKRVRWALGLSGVLSIVFAVVIIVWPGISLYTLVILFGAFALVRGVFGLVAAISSNVSEGRGWLIVSSLAGIVVGVLVFFYTDMSAVALLYVIGAYAIALGIIAIGGGYWLPVDTSSRVLLVLTGFVSILFGIVMFAKPGDGALTLLALIAAYALVLGILELGTAIGGERFVSWLFRPALSARTPQTSH
jgi:uncharacterized membrane protein HdeD (DUF308 family)